MFSLTRRKIEESKFSRAIERMTGRRGLVRQRSISAPPREPTVLSSVTVVQQQQLKRPMYNRGRSASCTALDWFAGDMSWSDVEASGQLVRSGSHRSTEDESPVLDLRHDCVKSSSPVVVHQDRPYSVTPLSAEFMTVEEAMNPVTGQAAPPPTPVRSVSYDAASRGTVEDTRADALFQSARRRDMQNSLLSVDIPDGALSPPANIYQSIWGKS